MLELIEKLIPFLSQYPKGIKLLFSAWVLLSAVLVLSLIFVPRNPSHGSNGQPKDTWLVIKRVRLYLGDEDDWRVQVIATVNGNKYTYPSSTTAKWVKLGPNMSPQRFSLPPSRNGYQVRFELEGMYRNKPIKMLLVLS